MKGFSLYQKHLALNLHFNEKSNYDFFRYNGKTRANVDSFVKSKYRWQYVGLENFLSDKNDLQYLYYCYKVHNFDFISAHSLFDREVKQGFNNFSRKCDQLTWVESELLDMKKFINGLDMQMHEMFKCASGDIYPLSYMCLEQNVISMETFLLIDTHIKTVLNNDASIDPLRWPSVVSKLLMIKPFVGMFFNKRAFREVFAATI